MKQFGRERLRQLEDHLRAGKLGHDVFDFEILHDRRACGTVGCALGELPYLFPDLVSFGGFGGLMYKGRECGYLAEVAEAVFDLTEDESQHLFFPGGQSPRRFGGQPLDERATRIQVADNIAVFLARREAK